MALNHSKVVLFTHKYCFLLCIWIGKLSAVGDPSTAPVMGICTGACESVQQNTGRYMRTKYVEDSPESIDILDMPLRGLRENCSPYMPDDVFTSFVIR